MTEDESAAAPSPRSREVRYEHSADLASVLETAGISVLISTYQAGKLVALGSCQDQLTLSFHNFDRPMGVALHPSGDRLAVAARDRIYLLRASHDIARRMGPERSHDGCWLTRSAAITGELQAHELGWVGDELWVVNTLFSCLCTPDPHYSFVPRWRPPFISGLAPEDRCHLNGLAMEHGRPRFVTAMAETDVASGWRTDKTRTGCVIDVESGATVARGFAMPHSPRLHGGHLWLLDSGRGALVRLDVQAGRAEQIARFPGYARGLAIAGNLAFIGLSKIRESSTFGGVPIAEHRERLKCGVAVMDLQRGTLMGQFEFAAGVDEIFDVTVLPGRRLAFRGPHSADDGEDTIWVLPESADRPAALPQSLPNMTTPR